jgi:ABC-type multidrug transport system ATPase subunit
MQIDAAVRTRTADRPLEWLGLGPAADQAIGACSKGMRQKVLIAAALLHNPEVLLFEDPDETARGVVGLVTSVPCNR